MISGKYTDTFCDASHAVASGMHMNADYPFQCPIILSINRKQITIQNSRGETKTVKIIRRNGREYFWLKQSSSFEKLFGKLPVKFKFHPFKDERTDAIQPSLFTKPDSPNPS